MICLIDTQEMPRVGIITRIRRALRGYKGITDRNIVILGMRVLYITVDKTPSMRTGTVQKRIQFAVSRMRTERVGKVQFTKNFPYRELILREGFDEIDESHLMELFTGKIVSALSGADKAAAFFANRLIGNAERVFCDMCSQFRYVMATLESDGTRLIAALGRRLGISIIGQPTEKQLLKADVAVFFSPPRLTTVLPDHCIAVPVTGAAPDGVVCRKFVSGVTVELANGKTPDIPDGFDHEPLFAAAMDAGTLRGEDVRLSDIKMTEVYM